jgi:predicted Abi (CAAX) family protease
VSISHEQLTAWGDVAESVKDWAVTALFVIFTAAVLAPLGFTVFLLLLNKIGNL